MLTRSYLSSYSFYDGFVSFCSYFISRFSAAAAANFAEKEWWVTYNCIL